MQKIYILFIVLALWLFNFMVGSGSGQDRIRIRPKRFGSGSATLVILCIYMYTVLTIFVCWNVETVCKLALLWVNCWCNGDHSPGLQHLRGSTQFSELFSYFWSWTLIGFVNKIKKTSAARNLTFSLKYRYLKLIFQVV